MTSLKSRIKFFATTLSLYLLVSPYSACFPEGASDSFWNGVGSEITKQVIIELLRPSKKTEWEPGTSYPNKPNIIAATKPNHWKPRDGYIWDDKEKMTVRPITTDDKTIAWVFGAMAFKMESIDVTSENVSEWLTSGKELISTAPDLDSKLTIQNQLAWVLATNPNKEVRNGSMALLYSSSACSETNWENPVYLDSYAAAQAELRNFDEAIRAQEKALATETLKEMVGDTEYEAARQRLAIYKQGKPFRKEMSSEEKGEAVIGIVSALAALGGEDSDPDGGDSKEAKKDTDKPQVFTGIGAALAVENGYTVVRQIIPGSPSEESDSIHPGDRIVGVAQGASGAMTNIASWNLDDTIKIIRGEKGSIVRLRILPSSSSPSGPFKTITLVRNSINPGTADNKSILVINKKNVTYWPTDNKGSFGKYSFTSDGFRNTYRIDCKYRRFIWIQNIKLSTGQITGNTTEAQWHSLNDRSAISNAVYNKLCIR